MDHDVPPSSNLAKVQGVVERVTFHNHDNGFTVLKVQCDDYSDLVTIVGYTSSINPGEEVQVSGDWVQDQEFGSQLKASTIVVSPPRTLAGIRSFLNSGLIKGVGKALTEKLIEKFGENTLKILDENPEELLEVDEIGSHRQQQMIHSWNQFKSLRGIEGILRAYGVSASKALRIQKTYGDQALLKIRENPYQLARDIPGIGFKTADKIGQQIGIKQDSLLRAEAGIQFLLQRHINEGHCGYPQDKLLFESTKLLEVEHRLVEEALLHELNTRHLRTSLVKGFICVFPHFFYEAEKKVSALIKELKNGILPWSPPGSLEQNLDGFEKACSLTLSPTQKLAVHTALNHKVSIITGGPGTGKSTVVRAIVDVLKNKKLKIALCAPTGRAAQRLNEITGIEAMTIHRLLKFHPQSHQFQKNSQYPLEANLIIIDEASMLDLPLTMALLDALPSSAALIMIGDPNQLSSVGPGNVLRDLISSEALPVMTLTQVHRQKANSPIIDAAQRIQRGALLDLTPHRHSDFFFLEQETSEGILRTILQLIRHRLPATYGLNPLRDIQVLSPMIKGTVGVENLNVQIQKLLNGNSSSHIDHWGHSFSLYDKVIVVHNDYEKEVFNGDIGIIKTINREDHFLEVEIHGKLIPFDFDEMDLLQLAYATTIHKSQGSEFPVVIIPIATEQAPMLQRNLLYTAITRAKTLVILVGSQKILEKAILNPNKQHRWTLLAQHLQADDRQS